MGLRRIEYVAEVAGESETGMRGAQMRSLSEYLGLSRRVVARLSGVNESSVYRWWGEDLLVSAEAVAGMQRALDASVAIEEEILAELQASGVVEVPPEPTKPRGRAEAPGEEEDSDLDPRVAEFGRLFYRVAAARALLTYSEGAVEPGRLKWATQASRR